MARVIHARNKSFFGLTMLMASYKHLMVVVLWTHIHGDVDPFCVVRTNYELFSVFCKYTFYDTPSLKDVALVLTLEIVVIKSLIQLQMKYSYLSMTKVVGCTTVIREGPWYSGRHMSHF
ncbi:uncharacterized protein EV154DRAFT_477135 [Mucor mucedo]|uniref:uncharacterized protein n=1 Tax=Mucor mucedo TaxID=29922 RepID=UPI0022209916|nr:uncharacterized protein EV154DRAFT_477135 [Mucor mucedo]KAI7895682.1 hypothetical protein EV154DRAFT_477135 [Mucor mucedo]